MILTVDLPDDTYEALRSVAEDDKGTPEERVGVLLEHGDGVPLADGGGETLATRFASASNRVGDADTATQGAVAAPICWVRRRARAVCASVNPPRLSALRYASFARAKSRARPS